MSTRVHIVSYDEPPEGFPGTRAKPDLAYWVVGLVVFPVCLLVGWLMLSAGMIQPKARTLSAIDETSYRIGIYFSQHHQLPPDLSVLPIRADHLNWTTDASGHPLVYKIDAADSFTLCNSGNGNQGDGANVLRFQVVDGTVQPLP